MEQLTLRGHHLGTLADYLLNGNVSQDNPRSRDKYGPENIRRTREFYDSIIGNPDARILLTDSLDFICHADCRMKKEHCSSKEASEIDLEELGEYKLKLGEFSSSEIIEKIIDFENAHSVTMFGQTAKIGSYRRYKFLRAIFNHEEQAT